MLKSLVITLTLIGGVFFAASCYAHPKLTAADPIAGAVVSSPKEIRLTFNEGLSAAFSGIELKDQQGQNIKTGAATIARSDKKLVIPISAPLPDGTYTITWYVVGADSVIVKGKTCVSPCCSLEDARLH